jgi:heavy metal translocating P-type ATPase
MTRDSGIGPKDRPTQALILGVALTGLIFGVFLQTTGREEWAVWVWAGTTLPVLLSLAVEIVTKLRRGELGLDIVAALSMTAALAIGETLAAAIVAIMYAGGEYLEHLAGRRARREMTALLGRVPRTALRHGTNDIEEVPVEAIRAGDRILLRRGDVLPVDGVLIDEDAQLDLSALTGEALPAHRHRGDSVSSGSANVGERFTLEATRAASESTYAGIVRLVEEAQRVRAPMSRLADRYALGFLAATVVLALAAWMISGNPTRAVAVLVVATPCPLILAVPIAWVAGLSRAARHGVLVKGGEPLEAIARIRSVILDKTGTLTEGRPRLTSIRPLSTLSPDRVLGLAASLDQVSGHPIARALADAAHDRQLILALPHHVRDTPGEGVRGEIDGHVVAVGGVDFVVKQLRSASWPSGADRESGVRVAVAVDGEPAGELHLTDPARPGVEALLEALKARGVKRILLATGDRRIVADQIAAGLPIDLVLADLRPEDKVGVVAAERTFGPVMMVGDGVNDAPALAAADVGVAMGARGSAATAETADVVLLVDDLARLLHAFDIARHSRRIAVESVAFGIGLSVLAMIFAAFGFIPPVQGALLQEAIDVSVILNALRALRDRPSVLSGRSLPTGDSGNEGRVVSD